MPENFSMRLLFVAVAGEDEDQVAKERQYAACKAHAARNAHQRRRQELRRASDSSLRTSSEAPCHRIVALQPEIRSTLDSLECQALEGTPLFDEAISFVRFYHHASWSPMHMARLQSNASYPGRRHTDRRSIQTAAAPDWLWRLFVTNVGLFETVVASIVPIFRLTIPSKDALELDSISLQLKAKSFLRLRQTLQSAPPDFLPSIGLIYHVKALFREASMNGDLHSADLHAKMLVRLVGRLPSKSVLETSLLRVALWSDAIPALLQLRRPVIDYHHWMPELVIGIWNSAESILPASGHMDQRGLPGCIYSQPLRTAFVHAHRALEIQQTCEECRLDYTEQIFQWMVTKAEYHMCSLLNLYFDLNENKGDVGLTQGARHTEAAMALALLHIYQKSFSNITRVDGIDMHESASVIHPALMIQLQAAIARCSPSERRIYRSAHLWLRFVGSCCETRRGYSPSMASGLAGQEFDARPLAKSDPLLLQKQALQLRPECCCADFLHVLNWLSQGSMSGTTSTGRRV